jgi:hypothetical protein
MKRAIVVVSLAGCVTVGAAALALWPRSEPKAEVNAEVNAEGCSCSRPTLLGSGKDQLSVYYCACPGVQCVLTATAAATSVPPHLAQSCGSAQVTTMFPAPVTPSR